MKTLLACLVVLMGVSTVAWRRTVTFSRARERQQIAALIAAKGAKPIPGCEAVDWDVMEREGARVWQRVLRGQRHQHGPATVNPFMRKGA